MLTFLVWIWVCIKKNCLFYFAVVACSIQFSLMMKYIVCATRGNASFVVFFCGIHSSVQPASMKKCVTSSIVNSSRDLDKVRALTLSIHKIFSKERKHRQNLTQFSHIELFTWHVSTATRFWQPLVFHICFFLTFWWKTLNALSLLWHFYITLAFLYWFWWFLGQFKRWRFGEIEKSK